MIIQDVRYAVRSLWHSRGFAAVAIVCLGLGIGVNTTIFSIVDGILLKPYPYEEPERILVATGRQRGRAVAQGPPGLGRRDHDLQCDRRGERAVAHRDGWRG
jgi:hypothetical protein